MYSPHPPDNRIRAFAPQSLVDATQNEFTIRFSEFIEMRRTIEKLADEIVGFRPNLIPFFATGGIPFAIPTMTVLYDRKSRDLVDGKHFHMFPGLSWNGKLDGVDSETYFAREFGELIRGRSDSDNGMRIWTVDATFTGNAIRKLIKALHRTFSELHVKPAGAFVSVIAVIDASRASKEPKDDALLLDTQFGPLYLARSGEFSPVGDLHDRQPIRFVRNDGDDLFDLNITYWAVGAIPTRE